MTAAADELLSVVGSLFDACDTERFQARFDAACRRLSRTWGDTDVPQLQPGGGGDQLHASVELVAALASLLSTLECAARHPSNRPDYALILMRTSLRRRLCRLVLAVGAYLGVRNETTHEQEAHCEESGNGDDNPAGNRCECPGKGGCCPSHRGDR